MHGRGLARVGLKLAVKPLVLCFVVCTLLIALKSRVAVASCCNEMILNLLSYPSVVSINFDVWRWTCANSVNSWDWITGVTEVDPPVLFLIVLVWAVLSSAEDPLMSSLCLESAFRSFCPTLPLQAIAIGHASYLSICPVLLQAQWCCILYKSVAIYNFRSLFDIAYAELHISFCPTHIHTDTSRHTPPYFPHTA